MSLFTWVLKNYSFFHKYHPFASNNITSNLLVSFLTDRGIELLSWLLNCWPATHLHLLYKLQNFKHFFEEDETKWQQRGRSGSGSGSGSGSKFLAMILSYGSWSSARTSWRNIVVVVESHVSWCDSTTTTEEAASVMSFLFHQKTLEIFWSFVMISISFFPILNIAVTFPTSLLWSKLEYYQSYFNPRWPVAIAITLPKLLSWRDKTPFKRPDE